MEKVYICLGMGHVMKGTGSKVREKDGGYISMQMEASIQVNIKEDLEKVLGCMSIRAKKFTKGIGKKIRRMDMG